MNFINKILLQVLFRNRIAELNSKRALYADMEENWDAISKWQLKQFNDVWRSAVADVPFYKWWASEHGLPVELRELSELSHFPVISKRILQENEDRIFIDGKRYQTVSTGGSTGQPTKFITSKKEKCVEYANTYLGRGMYGIRPLDETLLFWGHSHLFGSGVRGYINERKRRLFDALIGIERLNAYDLSLRTVEKYAERLARRNPKCIIGYTSSIYSLARFIVDNDYGIGTKSNLKGVIVTSETVTQNDIDVIEKAFRVPVISEYGMAETSVIAYSVPQSRGLRIFWDSFIAQTDAMNQLNITTLYDREFPLINYATNDLVEPLKQCHGSIFYIDNVKGRTRDNVKIRSRDGSYLELSGILLVHILKGVPGIYSVSYKQLIGNEVQISVLAESVNLVQLQERFKREIKSEHPAIDTDAIHLVEAKSELRTLAGKAVMRAD